MICEFTHEHYHIYLDIKIKKQNIILVLFKNHGYIILIILWLR